MKLSKRLLEAVLCFLFLPHCIWAGDDKKHELTFYQKLGGTGGGAGNESAFHPSFWSSIDRDILKQIWKDSIPFLDLAGGVDFGSAAGVDTNLQLSMGRVLPSHPHRPVTLSPGITLGFDDNDLLTSWNVGGFANLTFEPKLLGPIFGRILRRLDIHPFLNFGYVYSNTDTNFGTTNTAIATGGGGLIYVLGPDKEALTAIKKVAANPGSLSNKEFKLVSQALGKILKKHNNAISIEVRYEYSKDEIFQRKHSRFENDDTLILLAFKRFFL